MFLVEGQISFLFYAGTRMPTSCVPEYRCGTNAPGWLSGGHPTQAEGQVTRRVCFTWDSNCCHGNIDIKVRNCGSYYVYYLSSYGGCTGYCGTDWISVELVMVASVCKFIMIIQLFRETLSREKSTKLHRPIPKGSMGRRIELLHVLNTNEI